MKVNKSIFTALVFILALAYGSFAQDQGSPDTPPQRTVGPERRGNGRANMLQALGLSEEQVARVRQINAERKPVMEAAQKRLREANRALDAAIYADEIDQSLIDARLVDVQSAQAEVARIRSMNEVAVRRILTPEQLGRFREMRKRFDESRRAFRKGDNALGNRPALRFRRGRGVDRDGRAPASPAPRDE